MPVSEATGGSISPDSAGGAGGADGTGAGGNAAASEGGAGGTGCTGDDEFDDPTTGSCYRFVTDQPLDWEAAQSDCEDWGGGLAVIATAEENEFVARRVDDGIWLGGTDGGRNQEGQWRWVGGEDWDFTSFAPGQPDGSGDCLRLWYVVGAAWDDLDCTRPINYLCERDAG
jgi:hypothetical protein